MMKRICLIIIATLTVGLGLLACPVLATNCNGVEIYGTCPDELTGGNGADAEGELIGTVKKVATALVGLVGTIAGVVIVVAGIMYASAAGDPGKIATSKKMIIYAAIGLVIAISAFAITNFILGAMG